MTTVSQGITRIRKFITEIRHRLSALICRFPLLSFVVFLGLLVALSAVGNQLRQPAIVSEDEAPTIKQVQVFGTDSTPEIQVQAQVEKSGIIKLVAQTAGVVQQIKVTEGMPVHRGTQVLWLSTNYQGGNAMAVARQISQKNYQFLVDTYDAQKEMIARNRDLANKGETQQAELREIARESFADTRILIEANEDILEALEAQIETPPPGATPADIFQLQSARAQTLSALNGLRSGLRNAEYLNDEESEPAEMALLTRDNTLRQLEIQEKSLDLNKDLAALNVKMSQINESLMYPASPCPGVVERVYVKVGQAVSPGTVLATIKAKDTSATAVALVSPAVAKSLSNLTASTTVIDGETVSLDARYVSQEATEGSLHSILFDVPALQAPRLANTSYIQVSIPVGLQLSNSGYLYIPLDAVYQSQEGASVFVVAERDGKLFAANRRLTLGQVFGQYVTVTEGLQATDRVIINRNVIDGDQVSIQ